MQSPTTSWSICPGRCRRPTGRSDYQQHLARRHAAQRAVVILVSHRRCLYLVSRRGSPAPPTFSGYPARRPEGGSLQGNPLAIIMLGLLILLATPLARVTVSIAAFAIERDRLYIIITSIVLTIFTLFGIFGVGAWLGQPEPIIQHATPSFAFLLIASVAAGFIGALVSLGGGVFIVPIPSH